MKNFRKCLECKYSDRFTGTGIVCPFCVPNPVNVSRCKWFEPDLFGSKIFIKFSTKVGKVLLEALKHADLPEIHKPINAFKAHSFRYYKKGDTFIVTDQKRFRLEVEIKQAKFNVLCKNCNTSNKAEAIACNNPEVFNVYVNGKISKTDDGIAYTYWCKKCHKKGTFYMI